MKCAGCGFENPAGLKFCNECGQKLVEQCPSCHAVNRPGSKFCGECGQRLEVEPLLTGKPPPISESERKHVTILFSDLSGYTAMSERLDPEEVKAITARIFGEIAKVISRYEGFVEKYAGDAVMAIFGVPKAHEDDPVRAIKAAIEIHDLVEKMSSQLQEKVSQPLSMHSGINTGLVVTGEVNLEKGTHGLMGDAVNTAARILTLAKTGEILVGYETYKQSEGYFDFEKLEPVLVKGKTEPVPIFRVVSPREKPLTIRRLSGVKAELIGRKAELAQLAEAVEGLKEGKGAIFSICGDAGTGKSRLVEEFKATLDFKEVQLLESHAYAYSQNIPYFPLIDFLNRAFRIEEADPPEKVGEKVQLGVEGLLGKREHTVPFIGSLYALTYPELQGMTPELWKYRLQDGVKAILTALAQRMPTIFFLEDLHWADNSFLELLRQALSEIRHPALVIAAYRPPFSLFTTHQQSTLSRNYHEIRLQDLSPSEARDMVGSLLKTDTLPSELRQFVQDKAEGNPFYLEEVINSLIESEALVQDNGKWRLTKQISELAISSTVQGVISARLDRLEKEAKRILQEASVIGRVFLYDILKRVTEIQDQIDRCLTGLERLDLIRTRSLEPDLEYIFKHALTQEAVYSGLLKKERQELHARIGLVMEQLFHDRLPEFYETLAFHFSQGQSATKAVEYLVKAGQKSYSQYALEDAHRAYKEAYEQLSQQKDKEWLRIEILNDWAMTFAMRGAYSEMIHIFKANEGLVETLDDWEKIGMFYTWLGYALACREQLTESYIYLQKALGFGEREENPNVIIHSCCRLSQTCANLGRLDEARTYAERAWDLSRDHNIDPPRIIVAGGIFTRYFFAGDSKGLREIGKELLDEGENRADQRYLSVGNFLIGLSQFAAGNFQSAIESLKQAIQLSVDPVWSQVATLFLGYVYLANEQFKEAFSLCEDVLQFSGKYGYEMVGTPALVLRGFALAATGDLNSGLELIRKVEDISLATGSRYVYAALHFFYGRLYYKIVEGGESKGFSFMVKNIWSLIKLVPRAGRKSEEHFNKAIEVAGEIGARSVLGQAHLGLGLLHRAKGRKEKARESISGAIEIFEKIEAAGFLKQAREAMATLE